MSLFKYISEYLAFSTSKKEKNNNFNLESRGHLLGNSINSLKSKILTFDILKTFGLWDRMSGSKKEDKSAFKDKHLLFLVY